MQSNKKASNILNTAKDVFTHDFIYAVSVNPSLLLQILVNLFCRILTANRPDRPPQVELIITCKQLISKP